MFRPASLISATALLLSLAACGGGKTSNSPPVDTGPSPEYRALMQDVGAARLSESGFIETDFSELPTSGSASYDGVAVYRQVGDVRPAVIWEGDNAQVASRVSMGVDFGARTVRGKADRFHEIGSGRRLDGELDISAGIGGGGYGVNLARVRGSVGGRIASDGSTTEVGGEFIGGFSDGTGRLAGILELQTPDGNWQGLVDTRRD